MTYELLSVGTSAAPVVVESNELGAREAIRVHERAKGGTDLDLLRGGDLAGRVCWVGVLGLVLNTDLKIKIGEMRARVKRLETRTA